MRDKIKGLIPLLIFGIVISVVGTCIIYRQFPQFLCYAIYDVKASDLYESGNRQMVPGDSLEESFVPGFDYLTAVRIHVERDGIEEADNIVIGRLINAKQKVLAEASFMPKDEFFEFEFDRWVDTGEEYKLQIVFPEDNATAITTTFGPADIGPDEHRALYVNGVQDDGAIYTEYVYGTYSKKLLAFWLLIFFLGGMMIGDAVFYKKNIKN